MKRTLLVLLLFAIANIVYSFLSRQDAEIEQSAMSAGPVKRATHVRSAAAVASATPQAVPLKSPAAESGGPAANGARVRPKIVFEKGNLRLPGAENQPTGNAQLDFIKAYRSGSTLDMGASRYDVLNLRAIPEDQYDDSLGPVVSKKLNYVFVPGSQGLRTGSTFAVVARESNGIIGIVTGTVKVQMRDVADVSPVARSHGLTVKYVDETTKLAFFDAAPATSLPDLMSALRSDPLVENVTLEVIQSHKRF